MNGQLFGNTKFGVPVNCFSLTDGQKISMEICNYGCRILQLCTPDRNGVSKNIVLGYDSFSLYENDAKYAGAAVGRVANIIQGAQFEMDGKIYPLTSNDAPNHLHGGRQNFSNTVWEVAEYSQQQIVFYYRFLDGVDGYPGNLDVKITYSFLENGTLSLRYEAVSDRKTPISFTNHSYFNLDADFNRDVSNYFVQINADQYLELSEQALPTGRILPVHHSIFDFKKPQSLKSLHHLLLQNTKGYDHTFLLSKDCEAYSATVYSPDTGRRLQVYTDLPAIQFYTSNDSDHTLFLKENIPDRIHNAVCLETQYATDFVHYPHFPGKFLLPGELYFSETIYHFDTI